MATADKQREQEAAYTEFFGMSRPPFARIAEPAEIFFSDQYCLLTEHLDKATTRPNCLVVLIGPDGAGKTSLLNQYLGKLDPDRFFAALDDSCKDGQEFYRDLLAQLGFDEIAGTLQELRRITREFLVYRGRAGEPVPIFIDDAHNVSPAVLEQLRWIAETKLEGERVVSVVLAGNDNLRRILESPAMSSFTFSERFDYTIRIFTAAETADYVRHRLRLSGGIKNVEFAADALALIHRYTGGVPRSINRFCNHVLAEAVKRQQPVIDEDLARIVAERHKIVPHVIPMQGRGRRKSDTGTSSSDLDDSGERIAVRVAPAAADAGSSGRHKERELLAQIEALSEQLAEARAQAKSAANEIAARDKDIAWLTSQREQTVEKSKKLAQQAAAGAKEVQRLSKALSERIAEHDDARKRTRELDARLAGLQEAKSAVDEKLTEQSTRGTQLEGELKELKELVAAQNTTLKAAAAAAEELAAARQRVADLEAELTRTRDTQEDTLAGRDEQIAALREAMTAAEAEQSAEDEQRKALENELKTLRDELEAARASAATAAEKHAAEVAELRESLAAVEQERDDAQAASTARDEELQSLQARLADAEASAESLSTNLAERETELAEASKALAQLEQSRVDEQQVLAALEQRVAELQSHIHDRDRSLADFEKQLAKAQKDAAKQAEELAVAKQSADDKEKSLRELSRELKSLQKAKGDQHAARLTRKLDARMRAEGKLKEKLAALQVERKELKAKLKNQGKELKSLQRELESGAGARAQAQVSELQAAIKQLEGSSESADARLAELQAAHDAQREAAASAEKRVEELESAKAEQDKAIAKLEASLKTRQDELAAVNAERDEAKAAVTRVEAELAEVRKAADGAAVDKADTDKKAGDVKRLEQELAEARKELAHYESVRELLEEAQAEYEEMEAAVAAKDKDIVTRDRQITELRAQLAAAQESGAGEASGRLAARCGVLEVLLNGEVYRRIDIPLGRARIMVGREKDCELRLDREFVSRHHALLTAVDGELTIEDLNSANGTVVNRRKISRQVVKAGECANIGQFELWYWQD